MVKKVTYLPKFSEKVRKIDGSYRERVKRIIQKIIDNPEIGKPMMYNRKGTREVYLSPYRISHTYDIINEHLFLLDIYHKDKQ